MTASSIISALGIPAEARVDQRVAKKLLGENGAPTARDKRQINDGIEDLIWVAALKPVNIGVPAYKDDVREYLEIAVLHVNFRPEAKASRLRELIHRAIPYPVFLIQSQATDIQLSLAHLRWSQGQPGQTVLDGPLVTVKLDEGKRRAGEEENLHGAESSLLPVTSSPFLQHLAVSQQPRLHLHALYQGWIETFEAHAAARHTGSFVPATDAVAAERRRAALEELERITREMAALRARAAKEKQLNRRVEINHQLKKLESTLAQCKLSL